MFFGDNPMISDNENRFLVSEFDDQSDIDSDIQELQSEKEFEWKIKWKSHFECKKIF